MSSVLYWRQCVLFCLGSEDKNVKLGLQNWSLSARPGSGAQLEGTH